MGLQDLLAARGDDLRGILNGIDVRAWNPATDVHAPRFDASDLTGKAATRTALLDRAGWSDTDEPLIVMVTRLVDQKGVDLAFEAARFLEGMKARMIVLGTGDPRLAAWGEWLARTQPERFWFFNGYDAPLSHLLFAGGDLLLMPSRFEPCGLAQMQAMAYGTIPVVTAVGGLVDTGPRRRPAERRHRVRGGDSRRERHRRRPAPRAPSGPSRRKASGDPAPGHDARLVVDRPGGAVRRPVP